MESKYCFNCGSDNIVLQNEFNGEEVGLTKETTVKVYKCEYCGATHEVHLDQREMIGTDYWRDGKVYDKEEGKVPEGFAEGDIVVAGYSGAKWIGLLDCIKGNIVKYHAVLYLQAGADYKDTLEYDTESESQEYMYHASDDERQMLLDRMAEGK